VGIDHQQHGNATQPIEVLAASWWTGGSDAHAAADYRPSETENDTSSSMSWRMECQTEQYFSRESWIARSIGSEGTLPVMV
jgi:hypothetical protein